MKIISIAFNCSVVLPLTRSGHSFIRSSHYCLSTCLVGWCSLCAICIYRHCGAAGTSACRTRNYTPFPGQFYEFTIRVVEFQCPDFLIFGLFTRIEIQLYRTAWDAFPIPLLKFVFLNWQILGRYLHLRKSVHPYYFKLGGSCKLLLLVGCNSGILKPSTGYSVIFMASAWCHTMCQGVRHLVSEVNFGTSEMQLCNIL